MKIKEMPERSAEKSAGEQEEKFPGVPFLMVYIDVIRKKR